ncbi:hypothetical protein PILCRDRAFT_822912 [Piloderma croceum F 1598]|uniref:RRM domain-containing protein n=1 Tax=Piloderma croceum (strain F 1598) TaxID=765440 RepID=A0A0C3FKJ7_PILCF|nr:hypothetical protein PILCRDRAFT_822912 [Piloderma croceum F 1598]
MSSSTQKDIPQENVSSSLYVGGLDPTVTDTTLFEIFNIIGPVASTRVCRDAVTRRSLGYAYVNYLNVEDARRAKKQLNSTLIKNCPCRVRWSQRDPSLRKPNTGPGHIIIKNLDEQIDNTALRNVFAGFGNILSCKVATDNTGGLEGYGFVHYEKVDSADAAIKTVNGTFLNNKKVYVGHHVSRKERQSKIKEQNAQFTDLYVKNIHPDVLEEEFMELFQRFGAVTSAVIEVDHEGNSQGFGFVTYVDHEEAQKAVDALHDTELKGKKLFVSRNCKVSSDVFFTNLSYE